MRSIILFYTFCEAGLPVFYSTVFLVRVNLKILRSVVKTHAVFMMYYRTGYSINTKLGHRHESVYWNVIGV